MLGLHRRRIATALLAVVGLAGTISSCGGGVTPPPSAVAPVEFTLRLGVPVKLHDGPTPGKLVTNDGVATLELQSTVSHTVTIAHIDGADADPGLTVTYLGFTHCVPVCDKTGDWEDPSTPDTLRRSIEGQYPIAVEPTNPTRLPVQLVLRLGVAERGMQQFRTGCLWLHGLRATLADGTKVELRAFGGLAVLGAFAETSALPGSVSPGPGRCPLDTPTPS